MIFKEDWKRVFDDDNIAEQIKASLPKYKTAHFGKWHLAAGGPQQHGFDVSDGETTAK